MYYIKYNVHPIWVFSLCYSFLKIFIFFHDTRYFKINFFGKSSRQFLTKTCRCTGTLFFITLLSLFFYLFFFYNGAIFIVISNRTKIDIFTVNFQGFNDFNLREDVFRNLWIKNYNNISFQRYSNDNENEKIRYPKYRLNYIKQTF